MNRFRTVVSVVAIGIVAGFLLEPAVHGSNGGAKEFRDDSGVLRTFTTAGEIDLNNPFFQSIGTNGRTCNSCHKEENGWGISLENIRDTFERTDGLDPIFRTNDGSNAPNLDVSTLEARRAAYSMLLSR